MAFGPIGTLRCKQFDVFKDYFGLANVLKGVQEEKASGNSVILSRITLGIPDPPRIVLASHFQIN